VTAASNSRPSWTEKPDQCIELSEEVQRELVVFIQFGLTANPASPLVKSKGREPMITREFLVDLLNKE
jgi:hypothetical protein